MIKIHNLSVLKHAQEELLNISLEVERGECLVVIGPNGSGKSLLTQTIATGENDYTGEIVINHYNLRKDRHKALLHIGYLPNEFLPELHLTGAEYLDMVGSFYQLSPNSRLEKILTLSERFNCKSQLYSLTEGVGRSVRQKIGLITSLLHQPDNLVWDEPLLYLDESAQKTTIEILQDHIKNNGSALIATNNLDFAEIIADKIVVIHDGQILALGTLKQLFNQFKSTHKSLHDLYYQLFI
jgi:ABC-2 type transport system ATP-binding protein